MSLTSRVDQNLSNASNFITLRPEFQNPGLLSPKSRSKQFSDLKHINVDLSPIIEIENPALNTLKEYDILSD